MKEPNFTNTADDEAAGKKSVSSAIIDIVENQLKDGTPDFVTEIFLSLQKKGCNRKQARTVIASVLVEELNEIVKDKRAFDEKKYEAALKKRNRTLIETRTIRDVTLAVEEEINDACQAV